MNQDFNWDEFKKKYCSNGFTQSVEYFFGKVVPYMEWERKMLSYPSKKPPGRRRINARKLYNALTNAGLIKRPSIFG